MKGKCRPYHRLMQDYFEGFLLARDVRELDGHLAECADCAEEIDRLRAVHRLLESTAPAEETPIGFARTVTARIAAERIPAATEKETAAAAVRTGRRIPLSTAAGAAAVVIGGAVFAVWAAVAAGFGYYGERAYSFFDLVYITSFADLLWSISDYVFDGVNAAAKATGMSVFSLAVATAVIAAAAVAANAIILSKLKPARAESGR